MMKRFFAFLLTLVLILSLAACGGKDFARDENGYLTVDAAMSVATGENGYKPDDVGFSETNFTGDGSGEDTDAVYHFVYSDSIVEYTVEVNALNGSVVLSTAK